MALEILGGNTLDLGFMRHKDSCNIGQEVMVSGQVGRA